MTENRKRWMAEEIQALKAEHTIGTGEAYHVLKVRESYLPLLTNRVGLREVMNIGDWIQKAARLLVIERSMSMGSDCMPEVNWRELSECSHDIPSHHGNILGAAGLVCVSEVDRELDPKAKIFDPRVPRIEYEAFKPYWSVFKGIFSSDVENRLPLLQKLLMIIPGWFHVPGYGGEFATGDLQSQILFFRSLFPWSEEDANREYRISPFASDDIPVTDYASYFEYWKQDIERRFEDISEEMDSAQLDELPTTDRRVLYNQSRLARRFDNEQVLHQMKFRREMGVAFVMKHLDNRSCDDQFLREMDDRAIRMINDSKDRLRQLQERNSPKAVIDGAQRSVRFWRLMKVVVLENRKYLKDFFS